MDVDLTKAGEDPPLELAAFFELQQWRSLSLVERARLLKVFEIGVRVGARAHEEETP